jgi:hypothetical protein
MMPVGFTLACPSNLNLQDLNLTAAGQCNLNLQEVNFRPYIDYKWRFSIGEFLPRSSLCDVTPRHMHDA